VVPDASVGAGVVVVAGAVDVVVAGTVVAGTVVAGTVVAGTVVAGSDVAVVVEVVVVVVDSVVVVVTAEVVAATVVGGGSAVALVVGERGRNVAAVIALAAEVPGPGPRMIGPATGRRGAAGVVLPAGAANSPSTAFTMPSPTGSPVGACDAASKEATWASAVLKSACRVPA
jgi:hypothetical protein